MTLRPVVIVLTLNEELNLPHLLDSVTGWANRVLIVDSGSTDRTTSLAKEHGCEVIMHPFEGYPSQRNFALDRVRGSEEWALFLDADERLTPEIRAEIDSLLAKNPEEKGFFLNRRLIWQGQWIKRGYYPTWILRLVRVHAARCEDRSVNEHLVVSGKTGRLRNDFLHEDRKGLADWIQKHRRYAKSEAEEMHRHLNQGLREGKLFGTPPERVRWLRTHAWDRLPVLVRPFFYFGYRYFFRGGFLDGWPALKYHFLQGLWYPMLIDVNFIKLRRRRASAFAEAPAVVSINDHTPRLP
jgi:glycosyltransferase involved in cell wall biosynthesis